MSDSQGLDIFEHTHTLMTLQEQYGFNWATNNNFSTPPKINLEPENDGWRLEDVFPFPGVYSQVPC